MSVETILREFPGLLGQSLAYGTVLAVLTWLLCATLFRRARPAFHAALWTVVLLRFLVPPVLPGEIALSSWLARAGQSWLASPEIPAEPPGPTTWLVAELEAEDPAAATSATLGPSPVGLLFAAYLATLAWIAGRCGLRAFRHRRRIASLAPLEASAAREARALARRMGIGRRVDFRVGSPGQSPYVTGLRSACVVLPPSAIRMEEPARQALILHELAHVRRGDLWVRWLENAARVVFFFWPPVWWVCRRIERHSELACDQWALAVSRVQPDLYARSLLEIVKTIAVSPLQRRQLAFAGKSAHLEERFKMILDRRNPSPGLSWLMLPGLALWTAFAVAGGAGSQSPSEEKTPVKKEARTFVLRSGTDEALPAEVLEKFPGADLDGDGTLTLFELKKHLGAEVSEEGPIVYKFRSRGEGEPGEMIELKSKMMQRLLERYPEADLNGDGQLQPEELRQHHMEHDGNHFVFAQPGEAGEVIMFSGEGPLGEHDFDLVVGSRAELLQSHPEADADGDGQLSRSELQEWGKGQAAQRGRFTLKIDEGGDEVRNVEVFVWTDGEGEDVAWVGSHGVHGDWTSDEGHKIVVKIRSEDGEPHEAHAIVVDRIDSWVEDLAEGEDLTQGRAERLLKKYPEADLDGDGTLSKQEAAALAAKLAEERAQRKPR